MSIIEQSSSTLFKKIKYGKDLPGGGDSGLPYIKQSPLSPDGTPPKGLITTKDSSDVSKASTLDYDRISKFLKDSPKGPLFIKKQIELQLSNPQLETKQSLIGSIVNTLGSTRLYNGGVNTLAQVPLTAYGGHIIRHGLLPLEIEGNSYESIVKFNDSAGTGGKDNRLVKLKEKLKNYPNAPISQYIGGPNSKGGIGVTIINRYSDTLTKKDSLIYVPYPSVNYYNTQGVSKQYFSDNPELLEDKNNILTGSLKSIPSHLNNNSISYSAEGKKYSTLISSIETQITKSVIGISYPSGSFLPAGTFFYTGKSKYKNLPLSEYSIENRVGLKKGGDEINKIPLFISEDAPENSTLIINGNSYNPKDLVKFRIEAVDGDNPNQSVWMMFRAFVKDIRDNPTPQFDSFKYIGRGESFYIYRGFERNISFSFQIAAMSESEMKPLWQKLNYLVSNTAPDYKNNIMRAPYIKLTLGDYINRQPGIIRGLSLSIDNNSPWEVVLDKVGDENRLYELPHVVNVSMEFTPIHNFLPAKVSTDYDGKWEDIPSFVYGKQSNQNEWASSIYLDDKIPTGK